MGTKESCWAQEEAGDEELSHSLALLAGFPQLAEGVGAGEEGAFDSGKEESNATKSLELFNTLPTS